MAELRPKLRNGTAGPVADQAELAAGPASAAAGTKVGGGGLRADAPAAGPMHSGAGNFDLKDFSVWESHLALRLGVNRRDLIPLRQRHLQEGIHFVKNDRRLLYSALGVEKMSAVLSDGAEAEKSLSTTVLSEPQGKLEVLEFVVRRKAANTHVLECLADGKIVMVRVKDSAKFVPGMKVAAVPYGDLPNVYEFAGPYPRFRGKY